MSPQLRRTLSAACLALTAWGFVPALAGCGESDQRAWRGLVYAVADPSDFSQTRSVVWRLAASDNDPARVGAGYAPRLSPDGRWIAFLRKTRLPQNVFVDLYVAPASAGEPRRLRRYEGLATLWSIEWAPNSKTILLAERDALAATDRSGSGYRRMFEATSNESYGAFTAAPDSSAVALEIHSRRERTVDIFTVTMSGERRRLTHDGRSSTPVWGPDEVAFTRDGQIWLVRPDGSRERQLTHAPTSSLLNPVDWSRDARTLLAQVPPTHNGQLWSVDARTGVATQLTGWIGDLYALKLDHAGRRALLGIGCGGLISPRGRVEQFDLDTRRRTLLVAGPCRADWNE